MKRITQSELDVLTNIIGAVESGKQIYGQRDYAAYTKPHTNTPLEDTCHLGWCCFYGKSARQLIRDIFNADTEMFRTIDSNGLIESRLHSDWIEEKWDPSEEEEAILKKLIVTDVGKKCQDMLFQKDMLALIDKALEYDQRMSVPAQMMWCEIAHLGKKDTCGGRIFPRAAKPYTPESILESLMKDQEDPSYECPVGSKIFQERHEMCVYWINKYVLNKPGTLRFFLKQIRKWFSRKWRRLIRFKRLAVCIIRGKVNGARRLLRKYL